MNMQEQAREVLLFRDHLILSCLKDRERMIENCTWAECPAWFASAFIDQLNDSLLNAEVIIWTVEMYNAAIRGADGAFNQKPMPQSVQSIITPQIWYLADGVMGFDDTVRRFAVPVGSNCAPMLMLPVEIKNEHGLYEHSVLGAFVFCSLDRRYFIRPVYPMYQRDNAIGNQVVFIALCEFMNLTLTVKEPVRFARSDRRRIERQSISLLDINVIRLRRRESSERQAVSEREYHHQWIVKGHWRRLHAPRKKDGAEVTYVSPYVKGPDGAPLLPPRETVYAVTR